MLVFIYLLFYIPLYDQRVIFVIFILLYILFAFVFVKCLAFCDLFILCYFKLNDFCIKIAEVYTCMFMLLFSPKKMLLFKNKDWLLSILYSLGDI